MVIIIIITITTTIRVKGKLKSIRKHEIVKQLAEYHEINPIHNFFHH